jgi:hypothetical protein
VKSDDVTTQSSCGEHVNGNELNTDSSIDSLARSATESCDEHVNTDNEMIDLSSDSLLRADEEVAAINHMWCAYEQHVTMDYEQHENHVSNDDVTTVLTYDSHVSNDDVTTEPTYDSHADSDDVTSEPTYDSHVDSDDVTSEPTYDSHVDSDDDSLSSSTEHLPAFIKIPPDNYEVAETECGVVGIIVDPDYWDWLDLRPSSSVILPPDSEHGSGVNCDADSEASPHSSCHSPVPKEVASYSSRSSVNSINCSDESLNNLFNDCDAIHKAYEELRGKSAFTVVLRKFDCDLGMYNCASPRNNLFILLHGKELSTCCDLNENMMNNVSLPILFNIVKAWSNENESR